MPTAGRRAALMRATVLPATVAANERQQRQLASAMQRVTQFY